MLAAASAWARRLAEVPVWLKKRPTRGWRKEWKTTWAPLVGVSNLHHIGAFRESSYLVWGRAIQRIKTNLKM